MRAYVPAGWPQVAALRDGAPLQGPIRACVVDPDWRAGAPEVDEEAWEYEAQSAAAAALGPDGGVVLALDADDAQWAPEDGWVVLVGPVARGDVAALLSADLGWFGIQEIDQLLDRR